MSPVTMFLEGFCLKCTNSHISYLCVMQGQTFVSSEPLSAIYLKHPEILK